MTGGHARGHGIAGPRIALIHATPLAFEPIRDAFAADWPTAAPFNLLDDSLLADLEEAGRVSPALVERFTQLTLYVCRAGADAALFTCSAFGEAIDNAARQVDIPVLKPNEAMFEAALSAGERIVLLATSSPAAASLQAEFQEMARRKQKTSYLEVMSVPKAMEALQRGDAETHNRLLAQKAAGIGECDAVMLAHFSTARAAPAVRQVVSAPVLAAPEAAVAALKWHLLGSADASEPKAV